MYMLPAGISVHLCHDHTSQGPGLEHLLECTMQGQLRTRRLG